jgi:hypothetical protein
MFEKPWAVLELPDDICAGLSAAQFDRCIREVPDCAL